MCNKSNQNLLRVFGHRGTSMVEEGYLIVSMSDLQSSHFVKLRHRSNGSQVTLQLYPKTRRMVQKRNGKLVYDGVVEP